MDRNLRIYMWYIFTPRGTLVAGDVQVLSPDTKGAIRKFVAHNQDQKQP